MVEPPDEPELGARFRLRGTVFGLRGVPTDATVHVCRGGGDRTSLARVVIGSVATFEVDVPSPGGDARCIVRVASAAAGLTSDAVDFWFKKSTLEIDVGALALRAGVRVRGRVVGTDGVPQENAPVLVTSWPHAGAFAKTGHLLDLEVVDINIVTDAAGKFETVVRPGPVRAYAVGRGFVGRPFVGDAQGVLDTGDLVAPDVITPVRLRVRSTGATALEQAFVRLPDRALARGNAPLPRDDFHLRLPGGEAVLRIAAERLPSTIVVWAPGHAARAVEVGADHAAAIDVELVPRPRFEVVMEGPREFLEECDGLPLTHAVSIVELRTPHVDSPAGRVEDAQPLVAVAPTIQHGRITGSVRARGVYEFTFVLAGGHLVEARVDLRDQSEDILVRPVGEGRWAHIRGFPRSAVSDLWPDHSLRLRLTGADGDRRDAGLVIEPGHSVSRVWIPASTTGAILHGRSRAFRDLRSDTIQVSAREETDIGKASLTWRGSKGWVALHLHRRDVAEQILGSASFELASLNPQRPGHAMLRGIPLKDPPTRLALLPGRYRIRAWGPRGIQAWSEFQVLDGKVSVHEVQW